MGRKPVVAIAVSLLLAVPVSVYSHHSVWAEFDNGKPMELRGRFLAI